MAGVEALPQTTASGTALQLGHNAVMGAVAAGQKDLGVKIICVSERNRSFNHEEIIMSFGFNHTF